MAGMGPVKIAIIGIDCAVGIVGFLLSWLWGRTTGREMDADTLKFLAYVWGGIALFGVVMLFIF